LFVASGCLAGQPDEQKIKQAATRGAELSPPGSLAGGRPHLQTNRLMFQGDEHQPIYIDIAISSNFISSARPSCLMLSAINTDFIQSGWVFIPVFYSSDKKTVWPIYFRMEAVRHPEFWGDGSV
jgi:hypothetical protein